MAGKAEWIDLTLGMYYTLLNCGFRCHPRPERPTAFTPFQPDFGRVYVHLPDGFDYQAWRNGLQQGRSFVTTGPMLFATADGQHAGTRIHSSLGTLLVEIPIRIEVVSEQPVSFGEILVNGVPQ